MTGGGHLTDPEGASAEPAEGHPTASALNQLRERAVVLLDEMTSSNPVIRRFHLGEWTDPVFYRRHLQEAAIRIRLNNEIDALAVSKAIATDEVAALLLRYINEEYGHDRMLEDDLRSMGASRDELEAGSPLFSTELLISYLHRSVEVDGLLPALVWDWLVETYSARYNRAITAAAGRALGTDAVAETSRHLDLDETLEHEDSVSLALTRLLRRPGSLEASERYLDRFVKLIAMYFDELLKTCAATTADD